MGANDKTNFSHDEMRELMRRASEKQRTAHGAANPPGLSLEEIKRIAADVGVDPSFVDESLAELGTDEFESRHSVLVGGPSSYRMRRRVAGTIDTEVLYEIADTIRRQSKSDRGHIESIGNKLYWRSSRGSNSKTVSVSSGDGATSIEATADFSASVLPIWITPAAVAMLGFAGILVGRNVYPGLIVLAVSLAIALLVRFSFGIASRKTAENLETMMDAVEASVREVASPSPGSSVPQSDRPDLLGDTDGYNTKDVRIDGVAGRERGGSE